MKLVRVAGAGIIFAVISVPAYADWSPCGGANDKLWSWAWTGVGGEYVTLDAGNNRIVHIEDLSGNSHHYVFNGAYGFSSGAPFSKEGFSRSGWSTPCAPIFRDKMNSGRELYGQYMDQLGNLNADGPF